MKQLTPWILAAVFAGLSIGGCGRVQAPEPESAAPQVTTADNTPVPTLSQQRQDKRGD